MRIEQKLLRRGNLFELFILENNKKYLNITKKRINSFLKKIIFGINVKFITYIPMLVW